MGQLSKKEQKFLRRQQRKNEQEKAKQGRKIKKLFGVGLVVLIIGAGIFGIGWYFSTRPPLPESDIISQNGLHWHSNLIINIFGEPQDVPAGIGLERLPHKPTHTHDRDNVIHMEFAGLVKKEDIKLGKFFEIWGKSFSKDCIFDKCSGQDGQLKMLVNGKENGEFENYTMEDNDKIEIIFE